MADEIIEQEPIRIETKGKWQKFEWVSRQTFEVGKTYKITIDGVCEFAISKDLPTGGLKTNEIEYTKDNENFLWIRTKGAK